MTGEAQQYCHTTARDIFFLPNSFPEKLRTTQAAPLTVVPPNPCRCRDFHGGLKRTTKAWLQQITNPGKDSPETEATKLIPYNKITSRIERPGLSPRPET